MKWLLELGSCWGGGGATVTPAAEAVQTASTRQLEEVVNGARVRRRSRNKATTHWKPKLQVISEDNVVTTTNDAERRRQLRTVGSDDQTPSVRVKPKPKVKVSNRTSRGEDYWKSYHPIPVAAFSPAPFLF